ncbi:MAG TPA: glycosyltransferase, partial [Armatimonadota bacterium]
AGYVPRDEMRDYLAAADVLTFPSATETQGLVLCEAMAAGLPFVAVESPGACSVIPKGYEDYLIPNDAARMAALTLQLAGNRGERERLAALGRRSAESFSEEAAGRRLREIYDDVLQRRPAAVAR